MKKFYLLWYSSISSRISRSFGWIAVIAFLFVSTASYATHMAGGELTYRWLSGTTYVFTGTFYRDCAGVNAPTSLTLNYTSTTCGINKNSTMNELPGTGQEITFPCPSAKTTCSGGTNPGFQEWVYVDTVNIEKNCTDWVFSFTACCRNTAITTLQNPGSDNMYIEATLNNVSDPTASSPTFSNVPVTIVCAGQPFSYNQGSIDPNGDSLAYSFICPRTDPTTCVAYNSPYSPTNPIGSSPPAAVNTVNGTITMDPTTIQVGVATVLVQKYHNGVLVGSVLRDIEILVVTCSNNLPTATGINGTNVFGDTVCAGSNVCFNILSNDLDVGQIVTMTWNDGIPDATFTTSGSPHPTGQFCWTPSLAEARSAPYTFTVTVRDNNCPTNGVQSYAYSVWVPAVAVGVTGNNPTCSGSSGSATAVGSGGVSPYSYLWSPSAQTTSTATGLSTGVSYTVTATDKDGCTSSGTITLTAALPIAASLSDSTEVSCNGGNNGSATVTASGGAGSFTYHWSNGQTTNPAINLTAGSYTDTVKDANGCIKLVNVTITQPVILTASITQQQNASCNGETNGRLTVTAAGGTRGYSYTWLPNVGIDSTVTGLSAGTYTVTVTDTNGCTVVKTATITQPGVLKPLISKLTVNGGNNISCFGFTNGSVSVTVTGGTPNYNYLWSPGGFTTDSVTGLGAGTICVLVTDSNGCTADTCVTLVQPDSLIVTFPDFSSYFGGVNVSCNGASDGYINTNVIGGTPGYHYLWNTGDTIPDLSGLPAGTYSVTVTDTNGCSASQTITLVPPAPLTDSVSSQKNVGCNGEASGSINLEVNGGTAPYTFSWSTGDTTQNVSGLVAGTYTVVITDLNGCSSTLTDNISQPDTIFPLINSATVTGGLNIGCSGDTSGTAWAVVSGGKKPYTFLWSTGATTDTVYNIGAGPISVLVVDSNGCSKTANDVITQPEPVSTGYNVSSFLGGYNVSCNGSSDGVIQLTVGGGTPGYTYTWTPPVSTDSIATDLGAGQYIVIVTDTNGCKDSLSFVLTAPPPLSDSIVALAQNGGWNISCNGATDGSITLFVSGGNEPYSYTWTPNVSNTSTASGLGAGIYTITVADTNGCSVTDTITLTQPPLLSDSLSARVYLGGKNISCFGYSDGSITDSVSGGTPPYTFSWSTGDTTRNLNLDSAGIYFVTITDANGCSRTDSITLTQPDSINSNPIFTVYGIYNISCNGGSGCIQLVPTGGTSGYTYLWSPTEDSTSNFCDTAGTYHVLITDTNGCISQQSFTLTQPNPLSAPSASSNYNGSNVSCNSSTNGTITVTVTGGVGPYSYTWSPGGFTTDSVSGLGAGTYTVTVVDSNGCPVSTVTTLTAPPPLTDTVEASVYNGGYNITCAGNDGSITVVVNGGTGPYTYNWLPNVSSDSTADSLIAGLYIITVTDANGCSVTDSITLTQSTTFVLTDTVSDYNGSGIGCNGSTNGYIHVTVTGGVPTYTYSWSNGATTQNLDNIGAGTYTDTITDAQGCRTFLTETLTAPPVFSISAIDSSYNGSGVKCHSDTNGYIHVIPSGGTAAYHYQWSPNVTDTDSVAMNLGAGTYTFTVTDANGCSATSSETISAPPVFSISAIDSSYNGKGVKCNSDTNGYIHVIPSGGTAAYHYQWSPNISDTDSIAINLGAGTYTYTVTDANGCSATNSDTITAPPVFSVSAIDSSYNGRGVKCNSDTNGYIHVIPSGGTAAYHYQWSPNITDTDSVAMNLGAGTYTYTVTDANGCSATNSDTITAPPVFSISAIDSSYNGKGVKCNSDTNGYIHVIPSGGTAAYHYQWSPNVTDTDSVAMNLGAGTYTYTVTDANGCSATNSDTITAPPVFSVSAIDSTYNGTGTKCNGDSTGYIQLSASGGTPAYTYTWVPSVSTDSIASNLKAGIYDYTVTDANGCSMTGADTITSPPPIVVNAGSSAQVCGDSAQLSGNSPGNGYAGSWSVISGTGTFANANDSNTTVTGLSTGSNVLQWKVTDGFCSANDTVTINAFLAVASAGGPNDSVCPQKESAAMLNASSPSPGSGLWISVGSASVTNPMDTTTGVTNLIAGGNKFVWLVSNGPCSASDTVVIYVRNADEVDCADSLWMPTGFSPNGDGSHDDFIIQGVEDPRYSANTFKVFNRWGNEVYSVSNYNDQSVVWSGQNKQGDPLPDGTYFAILTITNSSKELHGYVDLRR